MGISAWDCAISAVLAFVAVGCATAPQQVALDYTPGDDGRTSGMLSGTSLTLAVFEDSRSTKFIGRNMIMREEDDPGSWVANALRLEMERAGAHVASVQKNVRPASGYHLQGRVNIMDAHVKGWQPGGLAGILSRSGADVDLNVTTILLKDGLELSTRTYDSSSTTTNSAMRNILVGGTNIPAAYELALQEMIREKILPDVKADLQ